ncbi:MAG: ribonuclease HII [Acidimicrobiia bacterium]
MTDKCCPPSFELELQALEEGADIVIGIDEVGRGALAGPLVVGACAFSKDRIPEGIDDSKRLSPAFRAKLAKRIEAVALSWAIARVDAWEIDRMGLSWALRQAARNAARLALETIDFPEATSAYFLVDGKVSLLGEDVPGEDSVEIPLLKGDSRSVSVAAASIIAKVHRDSLMVRMGDVYPNYRFEEHKGYGTAEHIRALLEHGPSPIHRRSFAPVRATMQRRLVFGGA